MTKNEKIANILKNFSEYVSKWNIPEIEEIYKKVIEIMKEIIKVLEIDDECIKIVEEMKKIQTLLATDVYYREHFIHQFQVFKLGYCIINKSKRIQDALVNYLREKGCSGDNDKVLDDTIKCWFLISIFHDLAYSIERIPIWLPHYIKTIFLRTSSGEKIPYIFSFDICRAAKYEYFKVRLIDLMSRRLKLLNGERPEFNKHINDLLLDQRNHGILGALILLNRLEPEDVINYEAALSIAFHTKDVYELHTQPEYKGSCHLRGFKLTFEDFPFAFLLMFCDNAQQWGRPSMRSLLNHRVNDQRVTVILEDINIEENEIKIILNYSVGLINEIEKIKDKFLRPEDFWQQPQRMRLLIYHKIKDHEFFRNAFV